MKQRTILHIAYGYMVVGLCGARYWLANPNYPITDIYWRWCKRCRAKDKSWKSRS